MASTRSPTVSRSSDPNTPIAEGKTSDIPDGPLRGVLSFKQWITQFADIEHAMRCLDEVFGPNGPALLTSSTKSAVARVFSKKKIKLTDELAAMFQELKDIPEPEQLIPAEVEEEKEDPDAAEEGQEERSMQPLAIEERDSSSASPSRRSSTSRSSTSRRSSTQIMEDHKIRVDLRKNRTNSTKERVERAKQLELEQQLKLKAKMEARHRRKSTQGEDARSFVMEMKRSKARRASLSRSQGSRSPSPSSSGRSSPRTTPASSRRPLPRRA